jgi:outer membrane protein, heavy metal efflux system
MMTSVMLVRARPRAHAMALGAAAAALALACTGPGAARYGALERRLASAAQGDAVPALEDDPFAGGAELSRAGVVEAVLRRNPTLRASRQAWRAALAQFPQATALADPMVGYSVAPRSLAARGVQDGHQLELAQPIPFPGTLRLRGEEALAEAEAVGHEFEAARLRLATLASQLFDDAYVRARALEVNHHHAALLADLRAVAQARYEAGEVAAQAPLQAEVELAQLERERATLEAEARIASQSLNALLHRRPDAPLPPPPAVLAPSEARLAETGRQDAALAARPELRAAEARVRGGEAAVALARRAFLPDVTLTAGYDGFWEESELRPMVGLAVEVPLQLGRRRAALEEARARLEEARSERAALESEVRLAVESGAARVAEAQHVLAVVRDRLLPAARDQLDAARAAFETGQEGFALVIGAEEDLREVELGEHEALAELDRRVAELESASGLVPGLKGGGAPW